MMFAERKPKFRSRRLDYGRTLHLYRFDQVDDVDEYDSPLRPVPQVATGVDKEEEEEHHLRQALSRQQSKCQPYYIPTPEAAQVVADYDQLYPTIFQPSKEYHRHLGGGDELLNAFPRYNADGEDLAFLEGVLSKEYRMPSSFDLELFERIIDCLEEAAQRFSENVVTSETVERLRCDAKHSSAMPGDEAINAIIEYWRHKRNSKGHGLVALLRYEDMGKIGADPYVCFRRRELKLPRKTRRSDAQTMERLKKLHLDLSTIRLMLQAAVNRDRYKREALILEGELFDRYRLVDNWRRHNHTEWPPQLPSFKTAAQSLLEPRKKKIRQEQEGLLCSLRSGEGEGEEEAVTEGSTRNIPSYKIAIPVAALRATRYFKPYYPHDVCRHIQKDLEALTGHEGITGTTHHGSNAMEDTTPDFDLDASWHQSYGQFRPSSTLGPFVCMRRGRGGRLLVDRPRAESFTLPNPFSGQCYTRMPLRMLGPRDISQLQTPVGNYNIHAVQTANQILKPMSFQAWVASTAPIVQALTSGVPSKGSPKKKKKSSATANPNTASTATVTTTSTNTSAPSTEPSVAAAPSIEISKLASSAASAQITVKVKSKPKSRTSLDGKSIAATNARFTPNGLTSEGMSTDKITTPMPPPSLPAVPSSSSSGLSLLPHN